MSSTSKTDWERLSSMSDEDIDTSEIPELGDEAFDKAQVRNAAQQTVTLHLDADVLEWFKCQGVGYESQINHLLRQFMQAHRR